MDIEGKRVAVVGLGVSGKAVARWLSGRGARVSVSEHRQEGEFAEWLRENAARIDRSEFGGHTREFLSQADIIVVSPGIPVSREPLASATRRGIPVVGELEMVLSDCRARIVAVTGTNGKTTTVALIGHMLRTAGLRSTVAGNIGIPVSDVIGRVMEGQTLILEVSSFQLDTAPSFRPDMALLLNVTPDHLDRYRSLEEYARAKEAIFTNQTASDTAVLNRRDARASAAASRLKSRVLWFDSGGSDLVGAGVADGWLVWGTGDVREKVLPAKELAIKGPHNLENALAALTVVAELGGSLSAVAEALRTFPGVEHRLEPAGSIGQVVFVNDSKATNVEALEKAILSYPEPVTLIAGGRDKNLDFGRLRALLPRHVREAVLIGEAGDKIEESWRDVVPVSRKESLEAAVARAYETARPRGVVLLSPGCASFDMFQDFEDRGRQFRVAVSRLAARVAQEGKTAR